MKQNVALMTLNMMFSVTDYLDLHNAVSINVLLM